MMEFAYFGCGLLRYARCDDALEIQLGYYMVMIGGLEIYNGAVAIFLHKKLN